MAQAYQPGGYKTFFIFEPKKRMISAAPFVDRVVHHCLINVIGPVFEPTFVKQSYANQKKKGTHRAIRTVHAAMRYNAYILQIDIQKYFPSIDHEILKALIRRKIKDPQVLWLVDQIIDHSNPQERVLNYFPGDDLFTPIERRKGLPIGNLTSQFFANVYLNGFDHFVKEKLGCHFYGRYVDDIVALGNSKTDLWKLCSQMERYLETLRLTIHPHKRHVWPVQPGLLFLGQHVSRSTRRLSRRNVRRFMQRMKKFQLQYAAGEISLAEIKHSFMSWLGHARQAHTLALRKKILAKIKFRRSSS